MLKKAVLISVLLSVFIPLFSIELRAEDNNFTSREKALLQADAERAELERKVIERIIYPLTVGINITQIRGDRAYADIVPMKGSGLIYSCSIQLQKSAILTPGHIGVGKTKAWVHFTDGQYREGDIIYYHLGFDFTLLLVPYAPQNCIRPNFEDAKIKDAVMVAGMRMRASGEILFTQLPGEIGSFPLKDEKFFFSSPVAVGSSGSGVWHLNGAYIGLVNYSGDITSYMGSDGKNIFLSTNPGGGMMVPISLIRIDIRKRLGIDLLKCPTCEDPEIFLPLVEKYIKETKEVK